MEKIKNNCSAGFIEIFDTTLRDGAQGEGISFSVQDKISVVQALDQLGIKWIEAGNPGSNPKDIEFFRLVKTLHLQNSKICAFGSTRKKGIKAENDDQLKSLVDAGTETVVIFGKSSEMHVKEVLKASPEENIAMISESITLLKNNGKKVFFDCEHFFDGFKQNPDYALKTIIAAAQAGADRIILCDTNGGSFPCHISECVTAAINKLQNNCCDTLLGIHSHNDSGLAIACSIAAIESGCRQVQGTLLGFGERCGNTNLAALIPSIELKMGKTCLPSGHLKHLSEISRRVAEIANCTVSPDTPYIGQHAFAHKAGMHADAIIKIKQSFEHVDPSLVGNGRHFLMSEQGGRSAIAERVKKFYPDVTKEDPQIAALSRKLKALESYGWAFDSADASFEILVRKEFQNYKRFFEIIAYRVQSEHPTGKSIECCHAWVKILANGQTEIAAAEGDGPVNALDEALRRALLRFYPQLKNMHLSDYKVRVIDGKDATAARVRVLIESTEGSSLWRTVAVSADILEASCLALVDSIDYKLLHS
ncbi:MAG: citramalate synthase [Spirochaetaceae bacterium]|jgi:2-isopropylmalate synthase|nr:citramalate synthase [Spirochaetaceae bacterium]